jgi:hypothetical protein
MSAKMVDAPGQSFIKYNNTVTARVISNPISLLCTFTFQNRMQILHYFICSFNQDNSKYVDKMY